jgi:hypothetical protein
MYDNNLSAVLGQILRKICALPQRRYNSGAWLRTAALRRALLLGGLVSSV